MRRWVGVTKTDLAPLLAVPIRHEALGHFELRRWANGTLGLDPLGRLQAPNALGGDAML